MPLSTQDRMHRIFSVCALTALSQEFGVKLPSLWLTFSNSELVKLIDKVQSIVIKNELVPTKLRVTSVS